ncbi:putative non-specific serine/threonine protein kinase [Helianthus annuus]|nr:putative non-specific serine/threonine protein kinase [Helianthus annuus]
MPLDQSNNKRMQFPLNIFTWLLLFSLILSLVKSDPRANPAANLTCGTGRTTLVEFIPTFEQAMERLSYNLNVSNSNFAATDSSSPPFYALTQCHRDLSHSDCLACYAISRIVIRGCLPMTSGRIFMEGCFVRYDNYSFFQEAVDPATDARICNFELVENISRLAVSTGGFGAMGFKGVYGLAQCWESVSNEGCRVCLDKARKEAISCLPSRGGRSLNAGCFLRYSTMSFLNNDDSQPDRGKSGISLHYFFI